MTLRFAVAMLILLCGSPSPAREFPAVNYLVTAENWYPYWKIRGNRASGIFYDLVKELNKRLPNQLIATPPLPIKRARILFERGQIQLECCVDKAWRNTKNEEQVSLWSEVVMQAEEIVIFPGAKPFPVESINDLSGKTIATILGFDYVGEDQFVRQDAVKTSALIKMVASGRVDAGIIDKLEYDYLLKTDSMIRNLDLVIAKGPVINSSMLRMRVHASRAELLGPINELIAIMRKDQTLDKIISKYVSRR